MLLKISLDSKDTDKLLEDIKSFQERGLSKPMEKSARGLLNQLRNNLETGKAAKGDGYPDVKAITKQMVIARSGPFSDSRIRNEVSDNPRAMNVTGQSSDSLSYTKVNDLEFNVGFDSNRSEVVFRGNAQSAGNTSKPKRDPLGLSLGQATDKEVDIVEKELEAAIDRILGAF